MRLDDVILATAWRAILSFFGGKGSGNDAMRSRGNLSESLVSNKDRRVSVEEENFCFSRQETCRDATVYRGRFEIARPVGT